MVAAAVADAARADGVRGRRALRRVCAHHAARDAAADPDHVSLRPERASAHDAARDGRSDGRAAVPGLAPHDRCRDRHRGPRLLRPPRRRRRRDPACRLHRRGEAEHRAGRLDDHRTAREERLRRLVHDRCRRRAVLRAPGAIGPREDPRGAPRGQARAAARQGSDPREVSEHGLLRPRRLRRRSRGTHLLRQAREPAHDPRVGLARRRAACARSLRSDRSSERQLVSTQLRDRPDGPLRLSGEGGGRPAREAQMLRHDPGSTGLPRGARAVRVLRLVRAQAPVRSHTGKRRSTPAACE